MANYQRLGILFALAVTIVPGLCINLQFENIYSQSFVPNAILTSYNIRNVEIINFNLTIRQQFPGRLLMHVFVRRLSDPPGGSSSDVLKVKNMDFCKSLESLRNLTVGHLHNGMILPSTFLITCPLMPGFYYIKNGVFNLNLLPTRIENGRYFIQMELIQIYEEVTKLLNCKIKCRKQSNGESQELDNEMSESEEENESDMVGYVGNAEDEQNENEQHPEQTQSAEVTEAVTEVEQGEVTSRDATEAMQAEEAKAEENTGVTENEMNINVDYEN